MPFSRGIGLSLALLTLAGCTAKKEETQGIQGTNQPSRGLAGWFSGPPAAQSLNDRYEVTAERIPVYFYSPAQPGGPNMGLTRGQKVTMVEREALFSRIRTEGGQTGYVATEYLKLLPPEPEPEFLPDEGVLYTAETFRGGSRRELPELEVVPIDMMLEEPPLPVQEAPVETAPSDTTGTAPLLPPAATATPVPTATPTSTP
ncbi:MAG TPA: SH3 domain-containing protein [Chthoniobacteraceae bacterium]|nr:SH3 domain-containing protein [Chthoniobacteraceae bacterium]